MRTFRGGLQRAGLAVTAELSPRNHASPDEFLEQAARLSGRVDGLVIGASADSGGSPAPLALAALLIRDGIDPIPRLGCRNRNRIALHSDLLGYRALGVTGLVVDSPADDAGPSREVLDLGDRELIAAAAAMNEEDWAGDEHEFVIGACAGAAPDGDMDPGELLARAAAGARFLLTPPCSDSSLLESFMARMVAERVTWQYAVIVTLALPSPEAVRGCADRIRDMAGIPGVSGFNLLSNGRTEAVAAVLDRAGDVFSGRGG